MPNEIPYRHSNKINGISILILQDMDSYSQKLCTSWIYRIFKKCKLKSISNTMIETAFI
jgi:hypothetical protein